jgi:hypothetical protein
MKVKPITTRPKDILNKRSILFVVKNRFLKKFHFQEIS